MIVTPKKHLGQHFLKDKSIAAAIVDCVSKHNDYNTLLEIGAGTGILTEILREKPNLDLFLVEIDPESVTYLKEVLHFSADKIIEKDFLQLDLDSLFPAKLGIIGNFPYNISSLIFFKILEHKNQVQEVVCMLQKEVAERLAAKPKSKAYGILSVFLQAYYQIDYHFTVDAHVFNPPPKVKSGVISLRRNQVTKLDCDEKFFVKVVKAGFNQRRKTLRNALKPLGIKPELVSNPIFDKRAEQLSVEDFVGLTNLLKQQ
jgi:16S rRNA (adenine1518-N6/adenine1519-N6)-dimethyltransferase